MHRINTMEKRPVRRTYFILAYLIFLLAGGTIGYVLIEENWSLLDAFYMTVITITTIGFGEIQELSPEGRIFTIVVIVLGVGLVASLISRIGQIIIEAGFRDPYGRRKMIEKIKKVRDHYIICGYGRIGRTISMNLYNAGIPFVVIEEDAENYEIARSKGFLALIGDASADTVLYSAGVERARGTVLSVNDDSININITLASRELNPGQKIIVRGSDPSIEYRFKRAGANSVVYPMKLGGEQIAAFIAADYGVDAILNTSNEVLGYELQIFKNVGGDRTVRDMMKEKAGVRPVAIHHSDGTMTHNPKPDLPIHHDESLLILLNTSDLSHAGKKALLEWNESLALGIPEVDQEHRQLIQHVRSFQQSLMKGSDKEAVRLLFEQLISYTENHFLHEEKLMKKHHYPLLESHHEIHVELTRKVMALNSERNLIYSESLFEFLNDWLVHHIMDHDKKFAEFLKK
jgi:voltage-gated potassium channel